MFKSLKESWQEAKRRVEEEDARAAAAKEPPPDMTAVARQFATSLSKHGLPLDFTPASLAALDPVVVSMRKELAALPPAERKTQETHVSVRIGAYVGEVLRRDAGGVWIAGSAGVPVVDLGQHLAPVVDAVLGLLANGHVEMPDGRADSLRAYYDTVSRTSVASLESIVRGNSESLQSLQREMSEDGELAAWLINQAAQAVETARIKWNVALDFTPGSLDDVEQVLGQLHDLLKTAPADDRPTDKQIETAALVWGVYVGEVLRRQYGGRWAISQPDRVLQLEIKRACVFPVRKVEKRLLNGAGDAIPFYFHAMGTALANK